MQPKHTYIEKYNTYVCTKHRYITYQTVETQHTCIPYKKFFMTHTEQHVHTYAHTQHTYITHIQRIPTKHRYMTYSHNIHTQHIYITDIQDIHNIHTVHTHHT